jgi:hypothetical protein
LCTTHNSNLSPVDEAAIKAFNVFRECVRLTGIREVMKERMWNKVRLVIDGAGLERWFLKTLINLTVGGKERIGPNSTVPGEPSAGLVEIAYGLRKFVPNAGLYSSLEVGETVNTEDRVTIIPFFDLSNESLLGGTFYFRGIRFMLYLAEEGLTGNVNFVHKDGKGKSKYSRPFRHLKRLNFTVGPSQKRVSHVVDFKW